MDIRYSPYNSPFTPSEPKGVYWIGLEYKDLPHNAHVYQYQFELARRQRLALASDHIATVAGASADLDRPFLTVCGCDECFSAARKMVGSGLRSTLSNGGLLSRGGNFDDVVGFGRAR